MKTIHEILSNFHDLDVKLWVEGERLRYSAPKGALTAPLKAQLRDRKSEIIEILQATDFASRSVTTQAILPIAAKEDRLLSFAQQRMWFLDRMETQTLATNLPVILKVSGPLNLAAIRESFKAIVQRHQVLRTTLRQENGKPIQVVLPITAFTLPAIDLRSYPKPEQEQEIQRLTNKIAYQPFDLANDILLRILFLQIDTVEHIILLTMHHIVIDGWSIRVLLSELKALYDCFSRGKPSPLPDLPIQYADFATWQRQSMQGMAVEKELSYWKRQLDGAAPLLQLPTDRLRPSTQTLVGKIQSFQLSPTLTEQLKAVSQQAGVTLFMTLLAAFKTLLYRYTNQEDIIVGSPVANRDRPEIETLIGCFINTVVLRTQLSARLSFRDVLHRVRETALGAYTHQRLPFEKLVEVLQPARDLRYSPLFQVMFVLQNAYSNADVSLPGLTLEASRVDTQTSSFDLTLELVDAAGGGLEGKFEYSTDLFNDSTITRTIGHFQTLVAAIVADPDRPIGELPLLTAAEQQQLWDWNQTQGVYAETACIHELFEAQVERTPDAIAIVHKTQSFTYRSLNQRANQLAHYLQQLGVKPEIRVGLCIERSPDTIVGLLAILKAGGAYVPLDPVYPQERLAFLRSNAGISVLVTQTDLAATLPELEIPVVRLDADWAYIEQQSIEQQGIEQQSDENIDSGAMAENLAYVIYTSGSTGQPKGVMIQHQSLVNHTQAAIANYDISERDRILQFASLSFDAAAEEIFPCLVQGATLVLRTDEMLSSIHTFVQFCNDWQLTVLDLPTAFWHQWVAEWSDRLSSKVSDKLSDRSSNEDLAFPDTIRLVIIGGEKALPERLSLWQQSVPRNVRLFNTYGPTEATIVTTAIDLSPLTDIGTSTRELPIGRAIQNARTYVLDTNLQPVPVGVPGELYIGGAGLARGYVNQPAIAALAFIPDPFSQTPGARLYKTGDLIRYQPDGRLEFLGRLDNQVKVRGFRIELREIEAVARQHPGIQDAVVVAQEDPSRTKRLIAYVVLGTREATSLPEGFANTPSDLRHFLQERLPDYMVPTAFVVLEALPLTPNGKIDRQRLPVPDSKPLHSEAFAAPSTPVEEILAGIWADLLGLEAASIHDNFFELGGHSLLAIRLMSQIRQAFKVEIPLRRLFESATLAKLAQVIEAAKQTSSKLDYPPIQQLGQTNDLPLSFTQQRLWFLNQLEPGNTAYNIFAAVRLQGLLKQDALEQSFRTILNRHEALRTCFKTVNGLPHAVVSPANLYRLPVVDLSQLSQIDWENQIRQIAEAEAQIPFNLSIAPLWRLKLLRHSDREHVVLLTIHHIAADGWAMGVLVRELTELYNTFCHGRPAALAALPIQYSDFASWQRQWFQGETLNAQLAYWRQQLDTAPASLSLPTDRPRPVTQQFRGSVRVFQLSPELSRALKTLSQRQGATLFMLLLAAFKLLLSRYAGSEDIVVGTPIANRNQTEIEGLIGCFVNMLALRTDLSGNPSFIELLARVRDVTLDAYTHQDLPFEKLVEELASQRSLSHTPLFQVTFVLQNAPMSALELTDLTVTPLDISTNSTKFDLTLTFEEKASQLVGCFEYNTDLFESTTIDRAIGHLQTLLEGVVANPKQHLSELPLLTDVEQHQLQVDWNQTQADYPRTACIHQLFEAQVRRTPDAIAAIFTDTAKASCRGKLLQLTYRELNARANKLARYLQQLGIGPDVPVGICVERSLAMVIGLLGILKAGGAYVPLDPNYPKERLDWMVSDSQLPVLLTQQSLLETLPESQARILCLDTHWPTIESYSPENLEISTVSSQLAYIIYTSGSTGKPKGVQIEHRSVANFLTSMQRQFNLTSADRLLAVTSISFDIAVLELYLPLISGACLVVASRAIATDGRQLSQTLTAVNATLMQATPATWRMLLTVGWQGNPALTLLCGGEALSRELAQALQTKGAILWNLYGPTETTIWSLIHPVREIDPSTPAISIGRPIANTQIYLLDADDRLVPIGVPGELHIGGEGLARGYLNHPELTAEKFVHHPTLGRLYKTGDLARYQPDGKIEYMGRCDYQVKIRGFRIELGEIEAALNQHPQVGTAIVVARENANGGKCLVAYLVPASNSPEPSPTVVPGDLSRFLQQKLPDYMVPAAFVMLESLPLTPNGKTDRKALPAPVMGGNVDFVPPRNLAEERIANLYAEILGLKTVGIYHDFFELGGHSLLATQVLSRVHETFGLELPLNSLFERPTVAGLAERIETMRLTLDRTSTAPVTPGSGRKEIVL